MKKRSVAAVLILTLITFGLYALIWHVKTKNEMNSWGAGIPTAWLILVPFVNLYWIWKWCSGIEYVTEDNRRNTRMSAPVAFLLQIMLPGIGMLILQDALNKAVDHGPPAGHQLPVARIA